MKYFLVQSFASILFILRCLWGAVPGNLINLLLVVSLLLKLGAGPLHA